MQARQEAEARLEWSTCHTIRGPLSGANTKSGEDGGSGARGGDGQALRPGHVFYLRGARGTIPPIVSYKIYLFISFKK